MNATSFFGEREMLNLSQVGQFRRPEGNYGLIFGAEILSLSSTAKSK